MSEMRALEKCNLQIYAMCQPIILAAEGAISLLIVLTLRRLP